MAAPDDIRARSQSYLTSSLELSPSLATSLEAALFSLTAPEEPQGDQTGNAYRQRVRQVALNLQQNQELLGQLRSGKVSVDEVAQMDPEEMKTAERAGEDKALKQEALEGSRGQNFLVPVGATGGQQAAPAASEELSQEGEVGAQEASLGEEGDQRVRAQPKIAGLEGIEFESGL